MSVLTMVRIVDDGGGVDDGDGDGHDGDDDDDDDGENDDHHDVGVSTPLTSCGGGLFRLGLGINPEPKGSMYPYSIYLDPKVPT